LVFWLGSAGVSVLLVVVGLLVPRLTAVRWAAVAAVLTWIVCILLGALLGPAAGRPPVSELAGVNAGYPVTQIAVAIAVAAAVLHLLPAPGVGLGDPSLDAPPRIRMSMLRWPGPSDAAG
jgi:hypothetical protein